MRYLCIHGHFYQPPRENPWTEEVERQPSAQPYHDWNERITQECYRPNARLGNYAWMSFDFGPTLLSWLQRKAPDVYGEVLQADRVSAGRFSGHGSAMAQPYNHMILPLANHRDRVTQVCWGIRDFEFRFGTLPEGMWLPETAVDLETLEILAERKVRFTVLAPHQAARVRPLAGGAWREVHGGKVDTTTAYVQRLPSGRQIALFFYHAPLSHGVAFEELLKSGERLAHGLLAAFPAEEGGEPRLVSIAADGESYGHHHRGGERALAEALARIRSGASARITNYGEFLESHPAKWEAQIAEKSSWSCSHGIDRWWSDCGCNSGAHKGWSQAWRTPLRNALDWLRDEVAPLFEQEAGRFFTDPWAARDRYVDLLLDRSAEARERFFSEQAARALSEDEKQRLQALLEQQRQALLMYTSCGWFFDDLAGIEAMQVLQYAGRAIALAEKLFRRELEPHFLAILAQGRSNRPECGDGRQIYERHVRPARPQARQGV